MTANTLFEAFASASTFADVQKKFSQLCSVLAIDSSDDTFIYASLKSKVTDWRAKKLWSLIDKRANQKEYCNQLACKTLSVLVVGAGPCGLRASIECAMLGASVILVEQRDCFSRNNVLHVWPFVINDLKNLGIKIFYPKFCRGSIDHISIRQLQLFLVKVALLVGVKVHESVAFQNLVFPKHTMCNENFAWRANFHPANHILSEYVFDILIGADGKRNALPGFPKQEMRGKLAIGITANFENQRTHEEEKVPEICGIAYIFNQQFFKDMKEVAGVDLENIVYYKDETHYFVMCAKKQNLLDRKVIIEDYEDVSHLLSSENVNQENLCEYAIAAADFATGGKLPVLKFASNHNDKEDVAMFDFTSLYSAKCSVRLIERNNQRLVMAIVGDSLHEPFWPTGSGIARGFLGVFDTAWMVRSHGLNRQGIMVMLAERESAYRLLAQAKQDNLQKQFHRYTIDPRCRYTGFELTVQSHEVSHLVDTDDPRFIDTNETIPLRNTHSDYTFWQRYKTWRFCHDCLLPHGFHITNLSSCWNDGNALLALIMEFRPNLAADGSVFSAKDNERMFQEVVTGVENQFAILANASSLSEWQLLTDDDKSSYLSKLVRLFQHDLRRTHRTEGFLANTAATHRREAPAQGDIPINRKADSVFGCIIHPMEINSFVTSENCSESFADDEICSELFDLNGDEIGCKKTCNLRRISKESLKQLTKYTDKKITPWTKRPLVTKLNPERLLAVEKIVSGELEMEKTREASHNKRRHANILSRKMDKKEFDEMQMKLKQTGMGMLFEKERCSVMSSKEKLIVSASAAAARQFASDGFKYDDRNRKFKEIDDKLAKANILLKNQSLAGVHNVTRALRTIHSDSSVASPVRHRLPPPTLPKKVLLNANLCNLASDASFEENVISKADYKSKSTADSRPSSMPIIELNYDSVNSRRQVHCQLCSKVVYLAERMHVEGMYIHKRCFRCAYCEQPLRLGHCAQDRNLEKYNPSTKEVHHSSKKNQFISLSIYRRLQNMGTVEFIRFFCMQHVNLPLSVKISRLERLHSRLSSTNSHGNYGGSYCIGSTEADARSGSGSAIMLKSSPTDPEKVRCSKIVPFDFNSPEALLSKTFEKMKAQQRAIDSFKADSFRRNCSSKRTEQNEANSRTRERRSESDHVLSNGSTVVRQHADVMNSHSAAVDDFRGVQASSSSSSYDESDEDELLEADLSELENFIEDGNEKLSDSQAICLLQSFSHRRMTQPLYSLRPRNSENIGFNEPEVFLIRQSSETKEISITGSCNHISLDDNLKKMEECSPCTSCTEIELNNTSIDSVTDLASNRAMQGLVSKKSILLSKHNARSDREFAIVSNNSTTFKTTNRLAKSERSITPNPSPSDVPKLSYNEAKGCLLDVGPPIVIFSTKEIQRIKKRVEKLAKQKEHERIQAAQDIQRKLQEIEIRKKEVIVVGSDLEKRLQEDSENSWILEQWLLYVQEFDQLTISENEIRTKIKLMEAINEYKELQMRWKVMQNGYVNQDLGSEEQSETDLLKSMLDVVEKRDILKQAINKSAKIVKKRSSIKPCSVRERISYRNYAAVFV